MLKLRVKKHEKKCSAVQKEQLLQNSFWFSLDVNSQNVFLASRDSNLSNSNEKEELLKKREKNSDLLEELKEELTETEIKPFQTTQKQREDNEDLVEGVKNPKNKVEFIQNDEELKEKESQKLLQIFAQDESIKETLFELIETLSSGSLIQRFLNELKEEKLLSGESIFKMANEVLGHLSKIASDKHEEKTPKSAPIKKFTKAESNSRQLEKMIEFMKNEKMLKNSKETVFIEVGSGKGGLSHAISEASSNMSHHILLEMEARSHKKDLLHQKHPQVFKRFQTNIKDFRMDSLPRIIKEEKEQKGLVDSPINDFILVSKHMCGMATDLTLNCLANLSLSLPEPSRKGVGLFLATCCHQLCSVDNFVGRKHLERHWAGFKDERIIKSLFLLSSWYISGIGNTEAKESTKLQRDWLRGLPKSKRMAAGFAAKRVIDLGRLFYLLKDFKAEGTQVAYRTYALENETPENFILSVFRD